MSKNKNRTDQRENLNIVSKNNTEDVSNDFPCPIILIKWQWVYSKVEKFWLNPTQNLLTITVLEQLNKLQNNMSASIPVGFPKIIRTICTNGLQTGVLIWSILEKV